MTGRHYSKRIRRSQSAAVRRRRRVVGWGTSAAAIAAFGMSPLVSASAHADGLEVIFDPIISAIDHAVAGVDALSGLDPAASMDVGGLGGGTLDQWLTLPTDSVAGVSAATEAATGGSAEAATTSSSDSAAAFDEMLDQSLHTAEQNWITSPLGESIDNSINTDVGLRRCDQW